MKKQSNLPSAPNGNAAPSLIGGDVEITGNVVTQGELQLDGAIKGDLRCGGLVMGETGKVEGKIVADNVTVRGKVVGEIRARSVRLEKSSIVQGDVVHETLSVEAGANLTGQFTHSSDPATSAAKGSTKEPASEVPSFVAGKDAAE